MAYSSLDDLKNRISLEELIQLTDDDNLGVVNTTLIDQLRLEADDLIDQHLKGRATLPLTSAPQVLVGVSADLTLHLLHYRRGGELPGSVLEQHKNAMKTLELFRTGKLNISDAITLEKSPDFQAQSQTAWFGSDELNQY